MLANKSTPAFARYIGIDYSGAQTPTASLKGLRVYMADRSSLPVEVMPPASPRNDLVCRWYRPHLERIHEDAVLREADLVQLTQIASTYSSRERFLTELTLDPPDATSDEAGVPLLDEDYLILSTIHSAKGREWTSVFLLNAVDGCLPSDLATGSTPEIEEERRLLYVAMTRAKDQLHLMVPQRFFTHGQRSTGDRHVYAQRTRFIPNSVLDQFKSRSWPPPKSVSKVDGRTREPVDVRAKMRRMWG
jgi:DNA helicase-2/ATP-dependent DNA helicase PcrA